MSKYARYVSDHQDVGKGSQGSVSVLRDPETSDVVAVKKISLQSEEAFVNFKRELTNLQKVDSPYIVKYLTHMMIQRQAEIFMEYIPGSLRKVLDAYNKGVGEEAALRWLHQLVAGLATVWENAIMHRDLKPSNILLTSEDIQGNIKICDFGISKCLEEGPGRTYTGTTVYMAPEVLNGDEYDIQADIWSLGIVFYEMLTGQKPPDLARSQNFEQMRKDLQGKVTEKSWKLLERMLVSDPNQRIRVEDLRKELRYMATQQFSNGERCKILPGFDFFTNTPVVFKRFPMRNPSQFDLETRISNFSPLLHWSNVYVDNTDLVFVLEHCPGGDLNQFIANRGPTYFATAKMLMRKLLQGLELLESQHEVHETIIAEHVLLTQKDYSADIKFANCCVSRAISEMTETQFKPNEYMSPEQIRKGGVVSPSSSIWSLGCIFYQLLTGELPFQPCPGETVLEAQQRFQPITDVSPDCADLIDNMLLASEGMRLTVGECLSHPFFSDTRIGLPELEPRTDIRVLHLDWAYSLMRDVAKEAELARDKNNVKVAYLLLHLLLQCFGTIMTLPPVSDWMSHYNDLEELCRATKKEIALQGKWAETRLQGEGIEVWEAFLKSKKSYVWGDAIFALCKGALARKDTEELKDAFRIIGLLYKAKTILGTSKAEKIRLHMLYNSLWKRQSNAVG